MLSEIKDKSYILIADDEPEVREILRVQFALNGYRVIVVENGVEAVREAEKEKPLIFVTDVAMPEMDGTHACAEIKRLYSDVPVIVLTALHSEVVEKVSGWAGADLYLQKPFDPPVVLKFTEKLIEESLAQSFVM